MYVENSSRIVEVSINPRYLTQFRDFFYWSDINKLGLEQSIPYTLFLGEKNSLDQEHQWITFNEDICGNNDGVSRSRRCCMIAMFEFL